MIKFAIFGYDKTLKRRRLGTCGSLRGAIDAAKEEFRNSSYYVVEVETDGADDPEIKFRIGDGLPA